MGLAVVVLSVLLFGLTTESGEPDWVSIVTAIAGLVMAMTGLYVASRRGGSGSTPTGAKPRAAT